MRKSPSYTNRAGRIGAKNYDSWIEASDLYSENFDTDPGYITAKGPNDNNISSVAYGASGSKAPYLKNGQYGGTSQYLSGTAITGSSSKGAFAIGSGERILDKSRSRSYITVIDTSAQKVGQYHVAFDVSDFQSADDETILYFHLYEGHGADNGYVEFQLTHQAVLPALTPTRPVINTGKGATAGMILFDDEIKGNGKFSLNFGITDAGKPGAYLALVWTQLKKKGSAPIPSMTIDNVKVSMLPAPGLCPGLGAKVRGILEGRSARRYRMSVDYFFGQGSFFPVSR